MATRSPDATDALKLLARSDPAARTRLLTPAITGALDEIGGAIVGETDGSGTRIRQVPRRRTLVLVAIAVAALAAGVATASVVFGAHTGLFPTKSEVAVGGPGEALNPAASDFRQVALQVASDIPYPRDYESWRDWVIEEQASSHGSGHGGSQFPAGLISTGALHGWFAASAFCAWLQDWRQAIIAGDSAGAAAATAEIEQAPTWKAIRDEDPSPSPTAANDPGALAGTLFGWLLPYRDAVVSSDRVRVEELLASGYGGGKCWLSDPKWMAETRAHGSAWSTLSQSKMAQKYMQFLARGRP